MSKMTITESLSEIKLITKKLERKRQYVLGNLIRVGHVPDPLTSTGGSEETLRREIQGCIDLEMRLIEIRQAIAKANTEHKIKIENTDMTIQAWLTWKREIAQVSASFYQAIHANIKREMDQNGRQPKVYQDAEQKTHLVNFIPNYDLTKAVAGENAIREALEKLDGLLSLKNATIVIEF